MKTFVINGIKFKFDFWRKSVNVNVNFYETYKIFIPCNDVWGIYKFDDKIYSGKLYYIQFNINKKNTFGNFVFCLPVKLLLPKNRIIFLSENKQLVDEKFKTISIFE